MELAAIAAGMNAIKDKNKGKRSKKKMCRDKTQLFNIYATKINNIRYIYVG